MTTIKEIAEKSGFSQATVSRLLNNDPKLSVSLATRNKILQIATELGYWSRDNKLEPQPNIALLYRVNGGEHLEDEYFALLKKELKKVCENRQVAISTFTDIHELISEAGMYQGFIGVGTAELTYADLLKLKQALPHGVFLDIDPAPQLFNSVKPNLVLTVQDAVDKLIEAGHQRLGFIGAESFNLDHVAQRDEREITFEEYTKFRHVAEAKIYSQGIVSVANGYQLAKRALADKGQLPDAFIVASDTLSVGVLQAFNEAGIKIPEETAIISINNSEIARYVYPQLSTYDIDQAALSDLALDVLLAEIKNSKRPLIHLTVNTKLIKRKSFM